MKDAAVTAPRVTIATRGVTITLRCPKCGGAVESTGSGPGWMNSDQWDSVKAGDYYCVGACVNPAREDLRVYFWRSAVDAVSSCSAEGVPS